MNVTAGKFAGNPDSCSLKPAGWSRWVMLADPHKFYHFRLRSAAASFLTRLLIRSHRVATRGTARVGGFVVPEMLTIATGGLAQQKAGESTHAHRHTPTHVHAELVAKNTHRVKARVESKEKQQQQKKGSVGPTTLGSV